MPEAQSAPETILRAGNGSYDVSAQSPTLTFDDWVDLSNVQIILAAGIDALRADSEGQAGTIRLMTEGLLRTPERYSRILSMMEKSREEYITQSRTSNTNRRSE